VLAVRVVVCALLVIAAACGDDSAPPSPASDAGSGTLEIGKGELEFAPLADGETLPYVAGAQGGHHVYISFRMRDLQPERVKIEVTTAVEGFPDLVLTRRGRQGFDLEAADGGVAGAPSYVYAGWPAQILEAPLHVGARARIDVKLTDVTGRSAAGSKTIVIGNPE
jgi:hypothetical protein